MTPRIYWLSAVFIVLSVVLSVWLLMFDGLATLLTVAQSAYDTVSATGNSTNWLLLYAMVCLVSQLLVIPSGSIMLMAAGFLFSPLVAAAIFSIAQVFATWPMYQFGQKWLLKFPDYLQRKLDRTPLPHNLLALIGKEGFSASVVLRLTPVVPSALACLLAAGFKISFNSFLLATCAVCWIRPLLFASVGGSLQALAGVRGSATQLSTFVPLILVFAAACLLFIVRVVMRKRLQDA